MTMAEQAGKTTGKTAPVKRDGGIKTAVDAASVATATGVPIAPVKTQPASQQTPTPPADAAPAKPLPEPSPRNGVRVNVTSVANAFTSVGASRSVGYVQHALKARGFDPNNFTGNVDHDTRAAYAKYQRSIDERPTGVPTEYSLDYLGFDVVG